MKPDMVHILLFSIILVAFLLRGKKLEKLLVIPFIILFVFAAIRYDFGNDYFSYKNMHSNFQYGYTGRDEYLYAMLNRMIPNYYVLIAVTSLIFVASVYLFVRNNVEPEYICLSVLIFVINPNLFLVNLSSLRQCLAMVIFMYSVPFAMKRKFFIYVLLIFLASMFHKSAILLLPMYFIANDSRISKGNVITIVAVILIGLSGNLIPAISEFLAVNFFSDANYIVYATSTADNSLRATLLSSVFLIYTIFNLPRLKGNTLVYAKLYLVGTLFSVFAIKLSMLTRIQMYFDIFSVVALPMIFKQTAEKDIIVYSNNACLTLWNIVNKYALPALILVIYCLRYYSFFVNPMWRSFTDYQTIFSVL